MSDCMCVKEMLLKSFVYADAERERESYEERVMRRKETKREKMEIERKKERDRPVCVLVGGN